VAGRKLFLRRAYSISWHFSCRKDDQPAVPQSNHSPGQSLLTSPRSRWVESGAYIAWVYQRLEEEAVVADVNEIEQALTGAIEKRMLEGSGKLSKVTTVDGVVQITFSGVTDDAHVFDTLSGALLDLRVELEVVPDLDVKIRRR
jgi:phosphoglucomutase